MKPNALVIAILVVWLLFVNSINQHLASEPVHGAVLHHGESLCFENQNGKVRISYISSLERKYEINNSYAKIVQLVQRTEAFRGRLGLYSPGDSFALFSSAKRLVLEESVRDFTTEDEIYTALRESSHYMDWVYTSNGLVCGLGMSPERRQVNITIWRILLKGKEPSNLTGARNYAIRSCP